MIIRRVGLIFFKVRNCSFIFGGIDSGVGSPDDEKMFWIKSRYIFESQSASPTASSAPVSSSASLSVSSEIGLRRGKVVVKES